MKVIGESWLATLVVASTVTSRCVLLDRRAYPSGEQNWWCFRHDCETEVRAYLTIFGSKIPLRVQSLSRCNWWLFREGDLTLRKVVRCSSITRVSKSLWNSVSALCSEEEGVGCLPKVGRNCNKLVTSLIVQEVAECA